VTVDTLLQILGSFLAAFSAAGVLYTKLGKLDSRLSALDERTQHHDRRITRLEGQK
jgi:hypothetical protein